MKNCPHCNYEKPSKNGKTKKGIQQYLCPKCKKHFLETYGTVYHGSHLENDEIDKIVIAHCEGTGIRAAGRIFGYSKHTIARIIKKASETASAINDSVIEGIEPGELQFDEMWTFVEKKRRK